MLLTVTPCQSLKCGWQLKAPLVFITGTREHPRARTWANICLGVPRFAVITLHALIFSCCLVLWSFLPCVIFFLLLPAFTMSWGSWIVFKGAIQHLYAFRNVQESLRGDLTDPVFSSDEYLPIKFLLGLGFPRDNGGNCLMHQAPCCYCIVPL